MGNPGIDELRAWVAQHPRGSTIALHYDPSWPPMTELDTPSPLFDRSSARLFMSAAGLATIVGIVLIGIALLARR